MSEIKRVALNSLEPPKINEKVIKKVCKTVRITVILPESNEDNSPEYNYKDQLAAVVKKKVKQNKDANGLENGLDPFGENDDDVRRIALEMEAKYGTGVTKKKRKGKKDDYADIGMGYDESDSFIDNTDGYDEIIPQNVTTLHGGFYVNSGALVFKTDDEASSNASSSASSSSGTSSSSDSEGEEQDKLKTKGRKRVLETSAESDSDAGNNAQVEKKPKIQLSSTSMHQAIKKKLFSTEKIQVKKRRPIDPLKKTVKDLLREKREDLNMTIPDELKTVEENIEKESSKENKKPMSITSVTDAIESVLKQTVTQASDLVNTVKSSVEDAQNKNAASFNVNDSQGKEKENKQNLTRLEKEEVVKLPDNLPVDIETLVSSLKEAALSYKGERKKAFFTTKVNVLLLNLEKRCKSISKSSRVRVYEHLSQYVNCTKDTLTRRARILELVDNEKRLNSLQMKLKDSIDALMPASMENFQRESQKIIQTKFSKENENNEEVKALKMPRRKFSWTEETKKLLKEVLSVKKRCIILEGKHNDNTLEEQVVNYLRTQIVPLWPEGWMYLNTLKQILNRMQDVSKSSSSINNTLAHSQLSITPVTNGKSSSDTTAEITDSITVTKIVTEDATSNEKNRVIPTIDLEKQNDNDVFENYADKTHDKTEMKEETSVFKPYEDKILSNSDNSQTYTKALKQNEMFKPYVVDEVIAGRSNVQDRQKTSEIIDLFLEDDQEHSYSDKKSQSASVKEERSSQQFSNKEKHTSHIYPENDKHNSSLTYAEKDKQPPKVSDKDDGYALYKENDKYSTHAYSEKDKVPDEKDKLSPEKDKFAFHNYSEKDKYSSNAYHEKEKYPVHVYPEKDKFSSQTYIEKDHPVSKVSPEKALHTYPDKDKRVSHSISEKESYSPEKDKYSSQTSYRYSEKDKQASHGYSEKDKHSSHSYHEKDKHSYSHSHVHSEKDKHSYQGLSERDKYSHSYSEKEKYSHSHHEKDKYSHSHSEKEKYSSHHPENDKYSSRTHSEKDKYTPEVLSEKEKHASHSYSEKDKHSSRSHSEKDKHSSRTYSDKDKYSSRAYPEKDKYSRVYTEKDKHLSREKDKYASRSYADKDKNVVSHAHPEKDKHTSRSHVEKDKYSSQVYLEKEKHVSPPKIVIDAAENSSPKQLEKASDLSKFQMFKPYSDTPKSIHSEESSISKSKDSTVKLHKSIDYNNSKDERHRVIDITKPMLQDSSNVAMKTYDYANTVYDVNALKQQTQNVHPFPGGNVCNNLSSIMEDSGVIVKNVQPKETLIREDASDPVISKNSHCQGTKRKLLDNYPKISELSPTNFYPAATNKHAEYSTSTPLVNNKSEGDGQKDIQMVMENLKALQKLSCSPIKNDNSASSPVSVIAYNKNFATSKTTSTSGHGRNDLNNRNDISSGFQDEFQRQFINSIQQMTGNSRSGYNNGS